MIVLRLIFYPIYVVIRYIFRVIWGAISAAIGSLEFRCNFAASFLAISLSIIDGYEGAWPTITDYMWFYVFFKFGVYHETWTGQKITIEARDWILKPSKRNRGLRRGSD